MRDLIRRSSGGDMERMRSGFDNFLADAFFRNFPVSGEGNFPQLDIYDTEEAIIAKVSLPGVKSEDVEITTNNDTLTIQGEMKMETGDGEAVWQERMYGKFYRSIKLPVPIKADDVKASFKNGILRIEMPKTDERKSRTIQITDSGE